MKIYLDLLPPNIRKELKRKKIFSRIFHQEILFFIPLVVLVFILLDTYYILSLQKKTTLMQDPSNKSQEQYKQLSTYEESFKQANANAAALLKIKNAQLQWRNLFEELSAITPDGITVRDFSNKDYQVFLVGKARSRDNLLAFKDNLSKSQCFKDINVPLSNLVTKDDVDFQIDFNLNANCLKRK